MSKGIFNAFKEGEDRFCLPESIYRVSENQTGDACLVIGRDETALVDTGMAYCCADTIKNIKKYLGERPLNYIFLTHSHYDHIGGLPLVLEAFPEAEVLASRKCAEVFKSKSVCRFIKTMGETARDLYDPGSTVQIPSEGFRVDRVLRDDQIIYIGHTLIRVIETKGHTDCAMSYYFYPQNLLFSSESTGLLLDGKYIQTPVLKSFADAKDSAVRCRKLIVDYLYLPHTGVLTKENVRKYFDAYIEECDRVLDFVGRLMKNGASEDKIYTDYCREYWSSGQENVQPREAFEINAKYIVKAAIRYLSDETGYKFEEGRIKLNQNVWNCYNEADLIEINRLNDDYRSFLDRGKTERECVKEIIKQAEEAGYINLAEAFKNSAELKPGDKVYSVLMKKAVVLFNIGSEPVVNGMNILGAHIDSPRLDLKQQPLYEENDIAYLDTHYYGGIKKYQWVALPLALHGVIVKKTGEVVEISIGESEEDPVVFISDLLIHLSQKQLDKKGSVVIEGEDLNVTVGNIPLKRCEKDAVKANVLRILKEKYGIYEEDFVSAEIEVVPAGRARECGLDRSMIMAYGQDDRVCAFTSLRAMLNVKDVKRTAACILVDKEEIGSVGATGMQSRFFENSVACLMKLMGQYDDFNLRIALQNSKMLSSDVCAAFDPIYASSFEKNNSCILSGGMVFAKYTGARGKSGSNDANAEYIAELRKIMDYNNVRYQTGELGKVDAGGGGTIAYILALYGMEVIDCGVALLNMHAPWEVSSKADVYETERGYEAFLKCAGVN